MYISACVHIPGETLKCAAARANTHACPSRAEKVDNPLAFPLTRSLLLTSACSPPALRSPLLLTHSARVRTLRDVRVCQWNTLSLSEDRREDGWEGRIGGGTVPGNSGSRSDAGGGKRLSQWLLVAHWRCMEAFDLSLVSLSLSPFLSFSFALYRSIATRHLSPSHLSIPPFSLAQTRRSLSASRHCSLRLILPPRSFPCELTHERTGIVCAHRSRPLSLDSFHSVSTRLVSIPPASVPSDPSAPVSPSDHPLRLSSPSLPGSCDSPPTAMLQSATTCIHLATKPPRWYSGPDDDKRETVH